MRRAIGVVIVVIFGILIFSGVETEEDSGTTAEIYIERGVSETGAVNLVTAVLTDYRVYDTLGETVILFTAILGVSMILRGDKK
jgi:multicomponent Na+:H+ antiporter subunit B